jgi:hypothetical protein
LCGLTGFGGRQEERGERDEQERRPQHSGILKHVVYVMSKMTCH